MIAAPSVLSLDYSRMNEEIQQVNESGAEYLHFDVMDGHFVPNLTFGPDILKGFCRISDLVKDVHLMVDDPVYYSNIFIQAGADIITFHTEALHNNAGMIQDLAASIHAQGKKAGLTLRPGTDLLSLKPFMNDFDLFLIMSVEPGFGGQKFIPESADRIAQLKQWIKDSQSRALIEVDGGINAETAQICADAGADILVAGSFVFRNDIRKAVQQLCAVHAS